MRVAAYTGGVKTPSARLRVRQYIPHLRGFGIDVVEHPLSFGKSRPSNITIQPFWAAYTLLQRITTIPFSYTADLTLLSRHFMPAFVPLEICLKSPMVLDVDDAIWLNRGGRRCAQLARYADAIICGNQFLANQFSQWNTNISILPTGVDTDMFLPQGRPLADTPPVIGWTGTSENLHYVRMIESPLAAVLQRHPDCMLRIVSDRPPKFEKIPPSKVDFVRWSPEAEVEAVRTMTVGIMPLENTDWERGKCSLKMLNYLASGVPAVVSPVGMNVEVLALGEFALAAEHNSDWFDALHFLICNRDHAAAMGKEGRCAVEANYSVSLLSHKLAAYLRKAGGEDAQQLGTKAVSEIEGHHRQTEECR